MEAHIIMLLFLLFAGLVATGMSVRRLDQTPQVHEAAGRFRPFPSELDER